MSKNKQYLIVDGYNVIFAWPELKKLSKESLEHSRLELQHLLQNYARYAGYDEVTLVFDGCKIKSVPTEEWVTSDFLLVYTDEKETADAYIERTVYRKQHENRFSTVEVVTSDGAEQNQVLGSGGLRIPARMLRENILNTKKCERNYYVRENPIVRNEVGAMLQDEDIAKKLEAIRLNKK